MRGALGRIVARLRRRAGGAPVAGLAGAVEVERPPVRQEYREMLAAAAGRGLGRGVAETAHELERRLAGHVGAASPDLRRLTSMYSEVRYGGLEPGVEEQERATAAAAEVIAGLAAGAGARAGGTGRGGAAARAGGPATDGSRGGPPAGSGPG
jgi:hypothetical protein